MTAGDRDECDADMVMILSIAAGRTREANGAGENQSQMLASAAHQGQQWWNLWHLSVGMKALTKAGDGDIGDGSWWL